MNSGYQTITSHFTDVRLANHKSGSFRNAQIIEDTVEGWEKELIGRKR